MPAGAARADQAAADIGQLQVDLPGPVVGCDPVTATVSPSATQILSVVLPSASATTAQGTLVQPDSVFVQAEVTNLNPLTIDYQIRKGAVWSDGEPVKLADFVATWRRGSLGSGAAASEYRLVQSVSSGSSSLHVVVVMKTPTSDWHSLFSPLMAAGTNVVSTRGCASPSAAADISAGPYVIAASGSDGTFLVRNPRWWGRKPAFSWIYARSTATAGIPAMTSNASNWLTESTAPTPEELANLTASPTAESNVTFSNRLVSIDFAMNGRFTHNRKIRLALSHVIDRRALISGTVAQVDPRIAPGGSHLLAQGQPGYSGPQPSPLGHVQSTTPTSEPSPGAPVTGTDLASNLLEGAGIKKSSSGWSSAKGSTLTLLIATPSDDPWCVRVGAMVAAQYGAFGIPVKIVPVASSAESAALLRSGRIDAAILVRPTDAISGHSVSWFNVPPLGPVSQLWAGYRDRVVAALEIKARAILNPVTAAPTYSLIDRRLWQTMPSLPLLVEPLVGAWSSSLKGVEINPYPPGTLAAIASWVPASG